MLKKTISLVLMILISSVCHVLAANISSKWVGGCCDGYWNDPNNWEPQIVPHNDGENTFDVTIEAYDNFVDVILVEDRIINQLDCKSSSEYDIDLGGNQVALTFDDSNGLTNYGNLYIADLGDINVEIHGNVTNYGHIVFEGGDIAIEEGDFINNGSAEIRSDGKLYIERTLSNFGQITIRGGKCVLDYILDNSSSGIITGYGEITSYWQFFRNDGSLLASRGLLYLNSESKDSIVNSATGILGNKPLSSLYINHDKDVVNLGEVEAYDGGVVIDCNLINDTNGRIGLYGGTLVATALIQKADGISRGFGGIAGNVNIDPNGIIKLAGPTNIVGDVEINVNATLEISDGITLVTGQTSCNDGTIHMKGGRLIPQGGFTNNNCTIIWEPGLYNNMADFNLDGKVDFKDFAEFADTWLWLSQL